VHVNSLGRIRLSSRFQINTTRHGRGQPGNDDQWRPFWRYWPKVGACHHYCGWGCFFGSYCAFYCVRLSSYHLSQAFFRANTYYLQIRLASNVRASSDAAHRFIDLMAYRKNYRKPLLQRYVVRILIMWVLVNKARCQ
jgi:hypothetical protein